MNCKRRISRVLVGILSMVIIMSIMLPFMQMCIAAKSTNGGASGSTQKVDVIFVIDDTASMQDTDPNRLSAEAIKKFVDKMPSNADIRMGIATYSKSIMSSLPLGQSKDDIKNFADNSITQNGVNTDAAVGLDWAVNQLMNNSADTRDKAIILVGDGENDFRGVEERATGSEKMLAGAVQNAKDKGIKVYTLAINPTSATFSQYFENIATDTNGKAYEPTDAAAVDGVMDDIFTDLGYPPVGPVPPITVEGEVTKNFEVPDGVFEMILQCDHKEVLEIWFTAPDGTRVDKDSNGAKYTPEKTYTTIRIQTPAKGKWEVTYKSDNKQTITPKFIFYADLTANLTKNQQDSDMRQDTAVRYVVTIVSDGEDVTDTKILKGYTVNLVIVKLDKNGQPGKTEREEMALSGSEFVLDYAIEGYGKYEVYAEISGGKSGSQNTFESNKLSFDVIRTGLPTWLKLIIIFGGILLVLLIVILIISLRNKEGGAPVRGNIAIKIVGRQANDETMIFPQDRFDCEQILSKKNTLSDVITAYVKRYRINNSSELAEMTLAQFINSTLSEVSDKVTICGNKKKQTIVRIPAGYDMQFDGMDISKPKKIAFSSPEKSMELRFKNQGCAYTITLVFTKI